MSEFHQFFDHCIGSWVTERTYHYLSRQEVERSHTEFTVAPIDTDKKAKVLTDNSYSPPPSLAELPGFHLAFATVSEHGDRASQAINLLFVPCREEGGLIYGDYLRDRAYEEDRPIVAQFQFDSRSRELAMTTHYTQVTAVDSITLVNPSLRIRKILYFRPPVNGHPSNEVVLAGFGVEQKHSSAT